MSRVIPRLFQPFKVETRFSTRICSQARPKAVQVEGTTRVPVMRFIQSSPKEYNGLKTAAYHFKQQRHMPYFLEYLMWALFGSEALHLVWLKMDMKEYKERTELKTSLLEEIIQRVENGEVIDDDLRREIKLVLMNSKKDRDEDIDDEYLDNLIAASEQKETSEIVKKPKSESKWVDVQPQGEGSDKKKPFFL